MRFQTAEQIQALIDHRIPESASLEYKRELPFRSRTERGEVLKDLTGMANGGGGTLLYGVDEEEREGSNVASAIVPLTDHSVAGAVEDLVRDGVQPPLLAEYERIAVEGGFVLAVDVRPSPLGPYMVTAHGKHSYFHRSGTAASPMNERQVRDAYALALRAREQRSEDWSSRHLPLRPGSGTWLVISALPEVLTGDVLDMRTLQPDDLIPTDELASHLRDWSVGGMAHALRDLTRWSHGFHGSDRRPEGWGREVRIHRDGAAALAFDLDSMEGGAVWTPKIYRLANLSFRYLAWLWQETELRSDVEVIIDVVGHHGRSFSAADPASGVLQIKGPRGAPTPEVAHREVVVPQVLQLASVRHGLVLAFADRMHQALGELRAEAPFRRGLLYGRDGLPISASLGPDTIRRKSTWGGSDFMARVHDRGEVAGQRGRVIGWHRDGVVMDLVGDAVAVVELASGSGCPDDFVAQQPVDQVEGGVGPTCDKPTRFGAKHTAPAPSGRWSDRTLEELIEMEGLDPFEGDG